MGQRTMLWRLLKNCLGPSCRERTTVTCSRGVHSSNSFSSTNSNVSTRISHNKVSSNSIRRISNNSNRGYSNSSTRNNGSSSSQGGGVDDIVNVPKHLSLSEYIFQHADKYGNKPALIDEQAGVEIGYEQLQEEIGTLSSALYHLGVRQRETVTLCCTNSPYVVHVLCSVTDNGATLSLASPHLNADELASQLRQSRSRYVIVTSDCAETAIRASLLSPYTQGVISIGEVPGCRPLLDLLKGDHPPHPRVHINPDSTTAILPFTPHTPGPARGAMLGHTNVISSLAQLRHWSCLPLDPDNDVSLSSLPPAHVSGLMLGVCLPLAQGVTVVSQSGFHHEHFLTAIQKHRVTCSLLSPSIVNFLSKHPMVDNYDLSSLTTPLCEAGTLGESLTNLFIDRLKLQGIRQGYGSTETCSTTHMTPLGGWRGGAVGKPLPLTRCKVIDQQTGARLRVRERGEVCIRGPQVMRGYVSNPRATQLAFTHDGWLKTGDLGYQDSNGEYIIVGQLEDQEDSQFAATNTEGGTWKLHPLASGVPAVQLPFQTLEDVPKAL